MTASSDERAFDTYLYLLKEFDQNKESTLALDYDNLAKSLGISNMSPEGYRRQITKILEKLENKYKLISYDKPGRNQNTTIKLTSLSKNEGTPEDFSGEINLPTTYFRHHWNQTLSFSAKVMLLINVYYSQASPSGRFSISREELSNTHKLSYTLISEGNQALRKLNLLNIQYSELENRNFNQRQPN